MTNEQKIKSMSTKELAEYIFELGNGSEYCYGHCIYQDEKNCDCHNCLEGVMAWLKQGTSSNNIHADGWISSKDRLPDIDRKSEVPGWSKEVIGYHRQYGIVFCYCRISTREWMLSKSCHITSEITHWMPLPEPPEKENES